MKKFVVLFSLMALTAISLSACGSSDERQAYIDATVESTCLLFETDDIFDPELNDKVADIFNDYGFDTDEDSLQKLKAKYSEDTEAQAAILNGISQCN